MQIKVIRSEVLCEGVSIGYFNIRIPVYTATEIAGIRTAFITAFGTDTVEWYRPRLVIGINENENVTNFLRSRTALFHSGGFMFRDAYATSTMKALQKQSANFIKAFNFTADITDAIMRIPAGGHGGTDSQYEYREIIFRNVETGDKARWIHDTYNPNISSTGSHLSRIYPASTGTGYSHSSLSFGFGSNGTDSLMEVAMPYLVMSEDSVIGYGAHLLMPTLDKILTSYSLLTSGTGNGYTDISQLPLALPELSDYLLSDGVMVGPDDTDDPYAEGGIAGAGGGTGTFSFGSSDPIDFPSVPELSAVSTGMVSIWSPTEQQMLDLTAFLWNAEPTTISFWKKLIANPLDLIYGLSIIPVDLRATGLDIIDGTGTVVVGLINTYIEMDKVSRQWFEVDCGSITIDETWGAYLDYDPFTKLEIYLPFCGTHPLRIDDFMPGTISLKYVIDLLTGTCVAMLKSSKTLMHDDNLESVIYSFQGNCATQIPVTAQQFADSVRSSISLAASIGTMVATGGAAVPGMLASTVDNVMGIKPGIERSGAIGSSGSLLGVRTPYLILTRPRQAQPARQNAYTGYPSFITVKLDDLSGYTEMQEIHLENMSATDTEIAEITALLKGGAIF